MSVHPLPAISEEERLELQAKPDYDEDGSAGPRLRARGTGELVYTREFLPPVPDAPADAAKPDNLNHAAGTVFHFHGMGAHMHRPQDARLARVWNELDLAWFAMDHKGHGCTTGQPALIESFEDLVEDMLHFVQSTFERFPELAEKPFFLWGESMGGALSILAGARLQKEQPEWARSFAGLLLIAPAIHNTLEPPSCVTWFFRSCLRRCCPSTLLCFGKLGEEMIWRTDEGINMVRTDPFFRPGVKHFRIATADELLGMTHEVQRVVPSLRCPLIVLHGKEDKGIPFSGSQFLHDESSTAAEDKELHLFDEAYHDLMLDPVTDQVVELKVEFVKKRLAKWQEERA